ncbi:hypothetical protein BCR43DRAFT_351342 [Syncephalastrum racemosum]|uniref:Uncharacterized protein n=1 Tax=Syncephalastrum racemosum TaxID=13706 RepID=A0A1X2H657_SYNRA|nr:hypothetical protein BCR43DRAFT_351342 [Syncephalastrum racemosum]
MFMPMWDIGSGSNLDPTRETVKCFCKCEYDNRKAKAKAGLGYGGYDIGSGYEEEHGGSHLGSFLYGRHGERHPHMQRRHQEEKQEELWEAKLTRGGHIQHHIPVTSWRQPSQAMPLLLLLIPHYGRGVRASWGSVT